MAKTVADLPLVHLDFNVGDLGIQLMDAVRQHGPIFRAYLYGGDTIVRMVGVEANRFVLNTHRHHFSHEHGWTPVIGEMLGRGLLNMDDPEHADHRRMWNPAFAASAMSAYFPLMYKVIVERTATWPGRPVVDVWDEARQITFDIVAEVLAGIAPGAELDRMRTLFDYLLHGWQGTQTEAEFLQVRQELVVRLLGLIAARRRIPAAEQPHDVLGRIIHARDAEGHELSDIQVLGHLNILLVAGHETTTTLGAWVLHLLATEPEQAARVRDEVLAAGPLTMESVRGMKLLDNFVREAGRIYPPVLNLPRGVVQPFHFGGYEIPAGEQIRLGIIGPHHDPAIFRDPERFDPDRFAPPREEDKATPYSLVTFGGNARLCIGMHFANIEVRVLAAHVLQHYDLAVVPGSHPIHAGGLTAIIPGGMPMRFAERAATVSRA